MGKEFPFHKGGKSALMVLVVLCTILIFAIPFAIWVFLRRGSGKVVLSDSGVKAVGLYGTVDIQYSEIARLGRLEVAVIAGGIGGALARQRVGNPAVHLMAKMQNGKVKSFIVTQYEGVDEILAEVARRSNKEYVKVESGVFSPKWPAE